MARFQDLALRLLGSTSGEQIIRSAAVASGTVTLPAGTADLAPLASPSFTGNVTVAGDVTSTGGAVHATAVYTHGSGNALWLEERTNSANTWVLYADNLTGASTAVKFTLAGAEAFRIHTGGVIVAASANVYKPGGGTWTDSSDVRLKKDITPFRRGLDAILALEPVRYRHNGRGETVDDGTVYTGLVADDVAEVLPEMIGTRRVKFQAEDKDETEVLTLDATSLIYALVNAVKELSVKIAALEGREPAA